MHLTLLSRGIGVHTTRRLVEAAERLGHRTNVVDPAQLQMGLGVGRGRSRVRLTSADGPLPATDVVIPRFAQSINAYGVAVLEQFAIAGVPVLNDAAAIRIARNHAHLLQLLTREGLRVPATLMGQGAAPLRSMVDGLGGLPVVIRLVRGGERAGVIVCESLQSMEAALEAVLSMGHDIIVQRYVAPDEGRDVRALVIGGEVKAAVQRRPRAGRLHRSLAHGAEVSAVTLSKAETALAIEAARIVGLEVAAIDLLVQGRSPTVFEVHASPGLRELEAVSHEDLATLVVQHALVRAGVKARPRSRRKQG